MATDNYAKEKYKSTGVTQQAYNIKSNTKSICR